MRKSMILIPAAVIAFSTCCHPARTDRELFEKAEASMDSAPDSVLRLLEASDPQRLHGKASRARYALLYSQALDKNYIDLTSDSVIAPAVQYFAHHGNARDKALTHYYLGRIRNNAGRTEEAAQLMLDAGKYAERAGETYLLGMIYNCRGNLYYAQYSFDEAAAMYDRADSCFRANGNIDKAALMLQAKGKTYTLMEKYDKAKYIFQHTLHLFDSLGNSKQIVISSSTLASIAHITNQITTDSLRYFLNNTYSKYTQNRIPAQDYYLWAHIYLTNNNIDSARYFGKLATTTSLSSNQKCGALSTMARIEEQAGNYQLAARYWDESYALFDSISRIEKHHLIQHVEKRYQNQQLQHQNEILRLHNRLLFTIGALVTSVIVFSLVLVLKRRRRIIQRKTEEIDRYQAFIEHLQENLTRLEKQYAQLTAAGSQEESEEENKMLQALEYRLTSMQKLLDLAYTGECKPQSFYKAFKEMATTMNRENGAFSDLRYLVNKRYCGVIDYLQKNYPMLTDSELDMLSMIQFGFTFDGIRLIYNHENTDSLYSRRTKIREKMQLPPRTRLEKYLTTLVEQLRNEKEGDRAVRA